MAERLLKRFFQGRRADIEDAGPVDHFKHVRSDKRLKLLGRECRIFIENRVGSKQQPKHPVGNFLNARVRAGQVPHHAHQIDIVNSLPASDFVLPCNLALDRRRDNRCKVSRIKRLAQVPAVFPEWGRQEPAS